MHENHKSHENQCDYDVKNVANVDIRPYMTDYLPLKAIKPVYPAIQGFERSFTENLHKLENKKK